MRRSRFLVASATVVLAVAACGTAAVSPSAATGSPPAAGSTLPSPTADTPIPSVADTPAPSASGRPTPSPSSPVSPAPTLAPAPSQASSAPAAAGTFTLRSRAFASGGAIPALYTCDGVDTSPDLSWNGVPDGTAALVLVVDDPDAGGFVHWLVLDMPPSRASLARGAGQADGSLQQGTNDFGSAAWGGPCPPSGDHHYRFTLYALAAPLGLHGAPGGTAVREALRHATVLGRAVVAAHYRRGG